MNISNIYLIDLYEIKNIYIVYYILNITWNFYSYSLDTKQVIQKYGSIINDFSYFKATSTYEKKIEDDPVSNIIIVLTNYDLLIEIVFLTNISIRK